jgi:hypothetical protein
MAVQEGGRGRMRATELMLDDDRTDPPRRVIILP